MRKRTALDHRAVVFLVGALALLFPGAAQSQRGGLAAQQNLAELVARARTIVRGQVVAARVEPHPEFTHLDTVLITMRVRETLKGEAGPTFTYRQFIWDIRDRRDAARYRKGQDLLLFLSAPSSAGLSSPIGLEQGRFQIQRDPTGKEVAVNGVGNYGLFLRLPPEFERRGISLSAQQARLIETHRSGPIALESLRELIRLLAGRE